MLGTTDARQIYSTCGWSFAVAAYRLLRLGLVSLIPVCGNLAGRGHEHVAKTLLAQEVEQLERHVELCFKRINLLEQLRDAVGASMTVGNLQTSTHLLWDQMPRVDEATLDSTVEPLRSADDFIVPNAYIHVNASAIDILVVNRAKGSSVAYPTHLFMASQGHQVRFYTSYGRLAYTLDTQHERDIVAMASGYLGEANVILLGDATGQVRVYKMVVQLRTIWDLTNQQINEIQAKRLSSFVTPLFELEFEKLMVVQIPSMGGDGPPRITSLSVVTVAGAKQFVAGDSLGRITVFASSGRHRGTVALRDSPIVSLSASGRHAVFRCANNAWGLMDIEKVDVSPFCRPQVRHFDKVTSALFDDITVNRIILADAQGTMWSLDAAVDKPCSIEMIMNVTSQSPVQVQTAGGYIMTMESGIGFATTSAYNQSHVGVLEKDTSRYAPYAFVWQTRRAATTSWKLVPGAKGHHFAAFLSDDGSMIEVSRVYLPVYEAYVPIEELTVWQIIEKFTPVFTLVPGLGIFIYKYREFWGATSR
eukprot:TRINITY_DN30210_c0_g1_i1.p1 TRINITY_DN30210_c0_g1~~TRINITY_DN30210_c0_g1_i1.p1  ORF type:complete len:533 (+),score=55.38 TRINITY_DN30210_c0_g1_i1:83-1681(+)